MKHQRGGSRRYQLLGAVLLLAAASGAAEEPGIQNGAYYYERRLTLGMTIPFGTIGGDFSNQGAIYSSVLAPGTGAGLNTSGLGITAGISLDRTETATALAGVTLSRTQGTSDGTAFDNTLGVLGAALRYEFSTQTRIRPFLLGGVNYAYLEHRTVPGGTTNYNGYGVDLAGGLAFYPYRRFSIQGSVLYRLERFSPTGGFYGGGSDVLTSSVHFLLAVEYAFSVRPGSPYGPRTCP
jgi:hypothetical protein